MRTVALQVRYTLLLGSRSSKNVLKNRGNLSSQYCNCHKNNQGGLK